MDLSLLKEQKIFFPRTCSVYQSVYCLKGHRERINSRYRACSQKNPLLPRSHSPLKRFSSKANQPAGRRFLCPSLLACLFSLSWLLLFLCLDGLELLEEDVGVVSACALEADMGGLGAGGPTRPGLRSRTKQRVSRQRKKLTTTLRKVAPDRKSLPDLNVIRLLSKSSFFLLSPLKVWKPVSLSASLPSSLSLGLAAAPGVGDQRVGEDMGGRGGRREGGGRGGGGPNAADGHKGRWGPRTVGK